jgi:hypothetical protein
LPSTHKEALSVNKVFLTKEQHRDLECCLTQQRNIIL